MNAIKISSGNYSVNAELKATRTASTIFQNLPIKGKAQRWGDEIYFTIPIKVELEAEATDRLRVGELGYWPPGNAFCIFFGKTPASVDNEPRAASKVNVFGKLVSVDAGKLRKINDGDEIIIGEA